MGQDVLFGHKHSLQFFGFDFIAIAVGEREMLGFVQLVKRFGKHGSHDWEPWGFVNFCCSTGGLFLRRKLAFSGNGSTPRRTSLCRFSCIWVFVVASIHIVGGLELFHLDIVI